MHSFNVFPFRHIEERFLWFQVGSCVLAIYVIHFTFFTIYGFYLVGFCFSIAVAVGIVIWRKIYFHYANVLPRIVQGKQRIFTLSATVTFGLAVIASAISLTINRYTTTGPPRYAHADVIRLSPPSYRSGWTADLKFEGDTHYLSIRPEHAQTLRCSTAVMLELQKGALGFDYITNIGCR